MLLKRHSGLDLPTRQGEPAAEGTDLRARVLVVDDERQVGTAIRRILSEHEVVSATTAREALRLLETDQKFDLILCDVAMADMTGPQLFAELGQALPELEERVVFMSGGSFTPEIDEFLRQVTRPCLPKPFGAAELRDYVNAFLRRGA